MVVKNKMVLSKDAWKKFVAENACNSYSLVVCLCILDIWEAGCKTDEEANQELHRNSYGISGMQAQMAIDYALSYDTEEWLDKDMTRICRDKNITVTEKVIQK